MTVSVVLRSDERDRRAYRIRLTEQGEKTCAIINASNDDLYGRVLDRLSMPVEMVASSFAAIVQAMLEVKDEDGFCLAVGCTQEDEVTP